MFFLIFFGWPKAHFKEPLLFWTSWVLPHGFQFQSGSLSCTLFCMCVMIPKVMSCVTPAFSTNRRVHCISMYTLWQPSLFDSHIYSHQTYPQQALTEPWPQLGLEPMTFCATALLGHSGSAIIENVKSSFASTFSVLFRFTGTIATLWI